ncbi:MAG: efflux RND transporter periplasmic adaptor subunit [Deltaproteobacteria bacterium]|nr:efflux RND transporter periplasmic adaptor subunit [Deltaproteobacteria bacterium]
MSFHRARIGLAASLAIAVASGCGGESATAPVSAPPVMASPVEAFRIEDRIEATGQLLAQSEAAVAAQVGGQVTRIVRDEGHEVAEGELVIEIDPERRQLEADSARAMLAQADAQAAEAARELGRMEKLHAEGVAADAKLDQVRTALHAARASRESLAAQLGMAERSVRDSSVTAPFAGLVARRWVSEGEFVAPGQKLFDLVALDPIEVEFHLAERDSSRVAEGAPVAVRVAPFPDEVFDAQVTVVSPTIDPTTRTLRVKAVLANPDGRLRPGLFARADLGIAVREGVPMIPEEAVLQRADGAVAFRLVGGGRVERRRLELGVIRDGRVEVRSGLAAGDRVIVRGQSELVDGAAVSERDTAGQPVADATLPAGQRDVAQPVIR